MLNFTFKTNSMRKFQFLILFLLVISSPFFAVAQENALASPCHFAKNRVGEKTTVIDAAENNYDIKYVKLDFNMNNMTTTLSGSATTKAVVLISGFNQYVFELINVLTIDSVLINGAPCVVTTTGDMRQANLPTPLSVGTIFTAQVFYHGTPPSGALYAATGINAVASPTWGAHATFTLSESFHAFEWWPCKQSLQDKIDSSDVWVTVADSLKAGSNGILNHITTIDASHVRYEWKERHPIDYYLVSVAVANYIDYSYYMHYIGSTDSTLVQNYIYANPATLTYFKNVIDSTGMMMDYFSTIYGRYPFWQEKYGHCMAPLGGGMEHETMTTCGSFSGSLVAHELAHQWFGDNVTCRTWSNIFMNEGMASYSEDLFYDHFNSHSGMLNDIRQKQISVLSYDTGTIFCPDTTENRVFDSRLSYDKGACVLHTLRFVVNNDSLFFAAYRLYQSQLKDSTGTIDNFKNVFEGLLGTTVNGINLDTFFNQWFYLQGYPKYKISWNQLGSDVYVKIIQTTAIPSSVPLFTLPLDFVLHSATLDTLVRVLNNVDTQVYHFTMSPTVSTIYFDTFDWLIYKLNGAITHDTALAINELLTKVTDDIIIAPNPATTIWNVTNLMLNSRLQLCDIGGKVIWVGQNNENNAIDIPAERLCKGVYVLKVINQQGAPCFYKLVK